MHFFFNFIRFVIIFSIVLSFNSCKNKKKEIIKPENEFVSYIQGFTSGVISNSDPIMIELTEEQNIKPGEKINKKIFDFKPEITGTTIWKTKNLIIFKPDKKLPSGQIYEANLHLSKILDIPEKLKTFKFGFQTKTQVLDVQIFGIQTYNNKDLKWNKLEGKLTTSDFANNSYIEKTLIAIQNSQEKKIRWQHDYQQKIHHFTIDSIIRNNDDSNITIRWNGETIGAKNKDKKNIEIPSISSFKVINLIVSNEPDQIIKVFFSDPISSRQNLKGLISFENKIKLGYKIDGNSIKIYPKQRIKKPTTLIINKNIRNSLGEKMKNDYIKKIIFHNLKPDIKTLSKGNILPNSKGLTFPFKAVNLRAVNVKIIKIFAKNIHQFFQVNKYNGTHELTRVGRIIYKKEIPLKSKKAIDYGRWNTFALDLSNLIKIEPGAIYQVEISFNKFQSLYPCEKTKENKIINDNENDNENDKYDGPSSSNNYDYYYNEEYEYYDEYNYAERENPCNKLYYYDKKHTIKQNIFASNFGIITKEDSNHHLNVFITDLITTKNLSGVNVKIYNYQNQKIGEKNTNSKGQAIFSLTQKPFLLVAKKNSEYGYLRLDDGNSLSLSMFNISGSKVQKGIKGYLFADRGVWRPGDSIYLNFILEDKQNLLPKYHPVILEIYNPKNQLFLRKTTSRHIGNFYDLRFAIPKKAITGNWKAHVKVGGSYFNKTLKIETIKPNHLKIILDFPNKILHSNDHLIKLQAKWLHGAIASKLKAIVEMKLHSGNTHFKNYQGYVFDDSSKNYYSETNTLFDGKLNENGTAKIPLNIINTTNAPGMLKANFKTRVFEKSGDFSIDRYNVIYSPYTSYVGIKIPKGKGWHNALFSDEENLIPIVTVNEYGKPVSHKKLKIEIYEIEWRWWWQHDNNENLGYYLSSSNSKKIITDYIDTKNGKAIYKLIFPDKTWGRKFIKITDPISGHSTGTVFYTDYKDWWNNSNNSAPGGAEMLTFNTNKQKYKVGEQVNISLPISKQGKALISIENGNKVIHTFWTNISNKQHQIHFTTTKEMSPNAFIHISYIQPHNQSENDRPIRLYGIQKILVEDPTSHLKPIIHMPDEIRPESNITIKVSEKNNKPMNYSIFVVDEGLLDLTHFKTPNPWDTFYAQEALGVKTYDMYDYVLGAFSGQIAGLLAIGGDEELEITGNKKNNRFKPVIKFLGTFQLNKGETKIHHFKMPNYIGSVRTMVVAGNQKGAYGASNKTTLVKKPLMVLASMPRVLGPEESIKLPITIFAMDKKIKNVKVKIKTNDLLKIKNGNNQKIHFDKEGEQIAYCDLQVNQKLGIAKIKIEVSSNEEKAHHNINIPIRIANPKITHIQKAILQKQKNIELKYTPIGISGTNKAILEISSIPPINLNSRLEYLIQYPHGCIEQTTSSIFPQLYLDDLMELSNKQKVEIQNNIIAGLQRLKNFQLNNGGFSYWPNEGGYANDWGTNFAGHFIIEAKQKGYQLPIGMLNNWLSYQYKRSNDWSSENIINYNTRRNQMIQAYRLYTLALAGKPNIGAMNRLREIKNLYPTAQWRLISAYYLAGKKSTAREMMKNLTTDVDNYNELDYTYGNSIRDRAMILESLILLKDLSKAKLLLDEISTILSSNQWLSTQTTSFSLLAISKFAKKEKNKEIKFILTSKHEKRIYNSNKSLLTIPLKFVRNDTSYIQLQNKINKTLFIRLINSGKPLESNNLNFSENLKVKIKYYDTNGNIIDESSIKQGTDFIIEVNVKHPGILNTYKNMALTQIFPSGWEITNTRMDNINNWKSDKFNYQDIRDDRVMTYFDLAPGQEKTFRIMANASYQGKYYLPSIKTEAMYNNHIINITNGKWIKIY